MFSRFVDTGTYVITAGTMTTDLDATLYLCNDFTKRCSFSAVPSDVRLFAYPAHVLPLRAGRSPLRMLAQAPFDAYVLISTTFLIAFPLSCIYVGNLSKVSI